MSQLGSACAVWRRRRGRSEAAWRRIAHCLPDVKQNVSSTRLVLSNVQSKRVEKNGESNGAEDPPLQGRKAGSGPDRWGSRLAAVRRPLVQILLEVGEEAADVVGLAEVGYTIREGVVVFEAEERGGFSRSSSRTP
jgi:hypothetical protein